MKLLVVDDEERIANSIKKGLEHERYTVDAVYNGNDGFDLATEGNYDLLILDLMLPGMDGMTICRKLRDEGIETPILMLTAKSQIRDRVTGLNSGADDYLTKPFAFAELVARVKALTRRVKAVVPEKLSVNSLTLDSATYSAVRKKTSIPLSKREYALLEYLLRNRGRVVTKDQIIRQVWEYDTDILPNTVEVFIKNIRLKIETPFPKEKPIIKTVRGFGYIVEEK